MRTWARLALGLVVTGSLLFAGLVAAPEAHASSIDVGVGGCTFDDAIIAADTDTAIGGCPAGAGVDTIILPGTAITASNTALITTGIIIEGNGSSLTFITAGTNGFQVTGAGDLSITTTEINTGGDRAILAAGTSTVLVVNSSIESGALAGIETQAAAAVDLTNSLIFGGPVGVDVYGDSTVLLRSSVVRGADIGVRTESTASVAVENSTIADNGTGVEANGPVSLSYATIADNGVAGIAVGSAILDPADEAIGGQIDGTTFVEGTSPGSIGTNSWPVNEGPNEAIDGVGQKYLNFGKTDTGVLVSPTAGASVAGGIQLWPANDSTARDPASWSVYGTNTTITPGAGPYDLADFTLIASDTVDMPLTRNPGGSATVESGTGVIGFSPAGSFSHYLVVFPTLRDAGAANSMQIAEMQLYTAVPSVDSNQSLVINNGIDCSGPVNGDPTSYSTTSSGCVGFTVDAMSGSATGSLGDNGCATGSPSACLPSIALTAGNPAIDQGGAAPCGFLADQRGHLRNSGSCDSGAFEAGAAAPAQQFCTGELVTIDMNVNGGNGFGTPFADVILGTPLDDRIVGFYGDDLVCAGDGADTIRGGPGDDRLIAEAGDDDVAAGGGNDVVNGGLGDDVILGQAGSDVLNGRDGNDTINGQGAPDTINGNEGDDTMGGQNGADVITGGAGDDTLRGQTGPDTLRGQGNNDTLAGGSGNDVLFGGGGTDVCAGNTGPADQAETATCETTPGVEVFF